jgi:hypothetical protein
MKVSSVQNMSNVKVVSEAVNYVISDTIELAESNIIIVSNTSRSINVRARSLSIADIDVLLYPNITINNINQNIDGGIIF